MNREQLCSQQIHCLSCPLSVLRTGRDCHEIKEDIMYIEGRWYTEPELAAYIKELKARISTLEAALEKYVDEYSEYGIDSIANTYIGIIANIEMLRLTLKNEEVKPF